MTPRRLSSYNLPLAQTSKATESSNLIKHFEWLDNLEVDKKNMPRKGSMTPDSRSSVDSSILHKDLLSYKTARQIVKNLTDSGFIKRSGLDKEFSKSLEPAKRSWNSSDDLDLSKTIGDSDRRGFINGLERFYKKNNLEVLEEDESPSEDVEKTYSKTRDSKWKTSFRKGLEHSDSQLSDKVMSADSREINTDHSRKKAESKKFKSLVKKFSVTMDQIDEKPPQAKRKDSVEKEKSVTRSTNIGSKKLSFDASDEQVKSRLTKTLLRGQDDLKTIDEQLKQKQKSLQNTFTEQRSKPDTPNVTSEISKSRSRQRNTVVESQSANISSSAKKLRLNNWMGPDLLSSKGPTSRTSPKNRPKEIPVTSLKKSQTTELYKRKVAENKGNAAGSSISLNSANIVFVTGGSGRSTSNTGSVETSDNVLQMGAGEGLASIVAVDRLKKSENSEAKNTSATGVGSRGNIGYLINTRNDTSKEPKSSSKSKEPIQKDNKKEGIRGLRLATDESDKLSERKLYNDIYSEENKRDKRMERSSSKESGLTEKTTPTTYSSKRMSMLNKKLTVDVVSPKLKDLKEEKKGSLLKEIKERIKEKSPIKARGMNATTNINAKKANDVSGASYGAVSIEPVTASKLKSPLSQTVKNTKIFGFEKDKNPVMTKYKDLKEIRTKMNPKRIGSSNTSKEWRNLDDIRALDALEDTNMKSSSDFIIATDLAVKEDHQPQQEAKTSDTNRATKLQESHDKVDKTNKVFKKGGVNLY